MNQLFQDLQDHISGYEIPVPLDAINVEVYHSNVEPTMFYGPEYPCSVGSHSFTDSWALRMVSGSDNAVMPEAWVS